MRLWLVTLGVLVSFSSSAWAILPGPMKDFFTPRPGDTTAVVFGTRDVPPDGLKKIELWAHRNADYLRQKDSSRAVEVYADADFPKELFGRRSLVLMGTTESNSFLAEWRNYFPFIFRAGRFNISGRKLYLGEGITLSSIFPNPLAGDRYVLLLVGEEPWVLPSLSDWPGDYDYYISQRHLFFGRYLNRGRFEKNSDLWSQNLSEYDRPPGDTATLVGLVYPFGKIWYPYQWEEEVLWKDPIPERIRLLAAVQDLITSFERFLGVWPYGNMDFHLSDRYPEVFAHDPMGRVFIRTHPKQMDSLAFLSWGKPLVRAWFPCRDASFDWELFGQRYFLAQEFFQRAQKSPAEVRAADQGWIWAEALTNQDSTYLQLLVQLVKRGLAGKIGEALDSVMAGGKNHSFSMRAFADVLGRNVKDDATRKMLQLPFHPSPYERRPAYDLGIRNLGELFLNQKVVLGELGPKSRAAAAGLRKGDKIISVDGFPTERNRSRAYLAWLGKKKGETLKLVIERKGVKRTLIIPLG